MASTGEDIFNYINEVYSLLSENDRLRIGETWTAWEQTYGDIWTKLFEQQLAVNVNTCPLYNNQRWMQYEFDSTTVYNQNAVFRGNQDLSKGIDLSQKYLVNIGIGASAPIEVDLRGAVATATTNLEIANNINNAFGFVFANLVVENALLELATIIPGAAFTGNILPAANIITGIAPSTNNMFVGQGLNDGGVNIAPGTIVTGIPTTTSITISTPTMNSAAMTAAAFNANNPTITFYPASDTSKDASALVLGLDPTTFPLTVPQFVFSYALPDTTVTSIPTLQTNVHDDQPGIVVLNQNTDYDITFGAGIISFAVIPPPFVWAKNSLLNLETPYNNFGYLMNFYDQNTPAYLKAVQGLWYAYWTGPTPENIRRSLYLLFGLPTASFAGTVTVVTPTQITLMYADQTTETFAIPADLISLVVVGQTVTKFQPLVSGITVLDKVNDKGFVASQVGRFGIQQFLTQYASRGVGPNTDETKALQTVEMNTYLPQIDVNAFVSADINLGNVKTFLTNMQPKSRTYFFQVLVGTFEDVITVGDDALSINVAFNVTPNVDSNMNTDAQESDLVDAETDPATGIILDSECMTMTDVVGIQVFHSAVLVDSFTVEG